MIVFPIDLGFVGFGAPPRGNRKSYGVAVCRWVVLVRKKSAASAQKIIKVVGSLRGR